VIAHHRHDQRVVGQQVMVAPERLAGLESFHGERKNSNAGLTTIAGNGEPLVSPLPDAVSAPPSPWASR
jgi:hypothetical protein